MNTSLQNGLYGLGIVSSLLLASCAGGSSGGDSGVTNQSPVAAFTMHAHASDASRISFDASGSTDDHGVTSYSWDFGDGSSGVGRTVTHDYADEDATYSATLTVTDASGLSHSTIKTVGVDMPDTQPELSDPPVAAVTATPLSGQAPLRVRLDASGSTDDEGVVSYAFELDGVSMQEGAGNSYSTTLVQPGTYTARVIVTDADGQTASATTNITVTKPASNDPPTAAFTAAMNGYVLTLGNTSSDANGVADISSYAWDFGDGSSSTEPAPSKTYSAYGSYTISLTVVDQAGLSDTTTKTVLANKAPTCAPSPDNTTYDVGDVIAFKANANDDGNNADLGYAWDFTDGSTSTAKDPQHTFSQPGTYTVHLTVQDQHVLSVSKTVTITIDGAPEAALSATPSSGDAPLTVTLDAGGSTDDNRSSLKYSFDVDNDGTFEQTEGSASSYSHTYESGNYTAKVVVTDSRGKTDAAMVSIDVANGNTDLVLGDADIGDLNMDTGTITITWPDLTGDAPSISNAVKASAGTVYYVSKSNSPSPSVTLLVPTVGSYTVTVTFQDAGDADQTVTVTANAASSDSITVSGTIMDNDGTKDTPVATPVELYWTPEGKSKSEISWKRTSSAASNGAYRIDGLLGPIENFEVLVKGTL